MRRPRKEEVIFAASLVFAAAAAYETSDPALFKLHTWTYLSGAEDKAWSDVNMPNKVFLDKALKDIDGFKYVKYGHDPEKEELDPCGPEAKKIYPELASACSTLDNYYKLRPKYDEELEKRGLTYLRQKYDSENRHILFYLSLTYLLGIIGPSLLEAIKHRLFRTRMVRESDG